MKNEEMIAFENIEYYLVAVPALVVDIIIAEQKRCTSNQYSYFDTSNNATMNTKRIFVERRRIR
jgi:hypothetical protein